MFDIFEKNELRTVKILNIHTKSPLTHLEPLRKPPPPAVSMNFLEALGKKPPVISKNGTVTINGITYLVNTGLAGYQVICVLFNIRGLPMLVVQDEEFGTEKTRTEGDYDYEPDGWEEFHAMFRANGRAGLPTPMV